MTEVAVETVTSITKCHHYSARVEASKPSAPVTLCKIDPTDIYDPWFGDMRAV